MIQSRRTFLKLSALGAALAAGGAAGWHWFRNRRIPQLDGEHLRLVRACVDLLVPADEASPGAIDLGVDRDLVASTHTDAAFRRLILRGGAVLQERAIAHGAAAFADLAVATQATLLRQAEAAPRSHVERRLFERLRAETLERYYARPESWAALCYQGPPQPLGFMDYTRAPRRCS